MTLAPSDEWAGSLELAPGAVLYSGPGGSAERHSHHAIQLIRSRSSRFTLTFEDHEFRAQAALVPSGIPHSLDAASTIDLGLIEPQGTVGARLQQLAIDLDGEDLGRRLPVSSIDPTDVICALTPGSSEVPPRALDLSEPVVSALAYIEDSLEGRPLLADAAAMAHISPSRLTHLFSSQVGIPFRNYVLWARLRRMIVRVGEGDNLTQAAHAAGFSDSAHLSRVFRSNFGLPPSALLRMRLSGDWSGLV